MKNLTVKLTEQNINQLKTLLLSQREEILHSGKTLRVDFNIEKDELKDEADVAVNDVEQGMKMRLGNRGSLYFKKIEEALLRLQEGTYGECLECGANINFRRLEARPTAELCIECKEAAERGESLNAEGRKHKSLGELVSFKA